MKMVEKPPANGRSTLPPPRQYVAPWSASAVKVVVTVPYDSPLLPPCAPSQRTALFPDGDVSVSLKVLTRPADHRTVADWSEPAGASPTVCRRLPWYWPAE